jgi:hypothetical protein
VLNRTFALVALFALASLAACKDEPAPSAAKEPAAPVAEAPKAAPPPPPVDAAPPDAALPTDPKELAEARNKAIMDGRYDQAVVLCAAEDMAKIGEQSVLGCVLAACQRNDVDRAQAWAKGLKTAGLKKQAKKTCAEAKIPL